MADKTARLVVELMKNEEQRGWLRLVITYSTGGEHTRWVAPESQNFTKDVVNEMVNWAAERGFQVELTTK